MQEIRPRAKNLTLTVRATNGGRVGTISDPTSLDLSAGFASLSQQEKSLLGTAVAEDVVGHTYLLHEYLGASGTVNLATANYSDATSWKQIKVDIFTETRLAKQIAKGKVALTTGQVVLVQFAREIFGRYQYLGSSTSINLGETDWSNTSVWKPLTADHARDAGSRSIAKGDLVQDRDSVETLTVQIWKDVDAILTGTVTIDADGAVALGVAGTMTLENLSADGDIRLNATSGIVDANTKVTDPVISGDNLNLTVTSGNVGSSSQRLLVALTNAARLSADVSGSIYLGETKNSLSLGTITATHTADLSSPFSIIDALNSASHNVVAANIKLASGGSVGSDIQSLGVRSTSTNGVIVQSGKDVYLSTETSNMLVGTITAQKDVVRASSV